MRTTQSLGNSVDFQMPADPLFVGSYIRVPLRCARSSGLTMEKLEFEVDPGPEAGIVSVSRERTSASQQPMILLGAGYKPGTNYLVSASSLQWPLFGATRSKGLRLVHRRYWRYDHAYYVWGGGPNSPQNINVAPAVGTCKIAVILIDSPTERFDSREISTVIQKWRNEIVDGVPDANGLLRSVAHFYREVSYFNIGPSGLNLEADFFGPVTMPATWDQ